MSALHRRFRFHAEIGPAEVPATKRDGPRSGLLGPVPPGVEWFIESAALIVGNDAEAIVSVPAPGAGVEPNSASLSAGLAGDARAYLGVEGFATVGVFPLLRPFWLTTGETLGFTVTSWTNTTPSTDFTVFYKLRLVVLEVASNQPAI